MFYNVMCKLCYVYLILLNKRYLATLNIVFSKKLFHSKHSGPFCVPVYHIHSRCFSFFTSIKLKYTHHRYDCKNMSATINDIFFNKYETIKPDYE